MYVSLADNHGLQCVHAGIEGTGGAPGKPHPYPLPRLKGTEPRWTIASSILLLNGRVVQDALALHTT